MGNTFPGSPFGGGSPGNGQPQFINQPNPQAGGFQYSYSPLGNANTPSSTSTNPLSPTFLGVNTPNLFKASQQYMPSNYSGNQPIYNPSSILQAYQNYLPQFMQGTTPMNQYQNPTEIQSANPNYVAPKANPFEQLLKNLSSGMPSGMPKPPMPTF